MFDIGWGELLLIGIVALVAIGPKELPTVLRSLGQWMGKIKRMAGEFQGQFQEALREAEMADLKKHADDLTSAVTDATKWDPLADIDNDGEAAASESKPAPAEGEATKTETASETATETAHESGGETATGAPAAVETGDLASAEGEESLPPIDVPPPEAPEPVTEKDFAPADEPPPQQAAKQAGGKA
jgi:sec-independent protein translocase protein TatB